MENVLEYIRAFVCGGILCVIGQILIDKTKLTPARILVSYVVAGVVLGALGFYQPIADWGGAGATVPLTGFGFSLAKGVQKAVAEDGLLGAITGGLSQRNAMNFESQQELLNVLRSRAKPGDVLLFKGSHGMHMENILKAFMEEEK